MRAVAFRFVSPGPMPRSPIREVPQKTSYRLRSALVVRTPGKRAGRHGAGPIPEPALPVPFFLRPACASRTSGRSAETITVNRGLATPANGHNQQEDPRQESDADDDCRPDRNTWNHQNQRKRECGPPHRHGEHDRPREPTGPGTHARYPRRQRLHAGPSSIHRRFLSDNHEPASATARGGPGMVPRLSPRQIEAFGEEHGQEIPGFPDIVSPRPLGGHLAPTICQRISLPTLRLRPRLGPRP